MSVSTHRIRTIHGSFGAPTRFGSASLNPAQASWDRIPNVCAPRCRSYDLAPQAPSPRTTPATGSSGSPGYGLGMRTTSLSSASGSRPRRTSVSYGSPMPARRAPPPPPVPAERTASALSTSTAPVPIVSMPVVTPEADDPFADAEHVENVLTPLSPTPVRPTSVSTRSRISVSTYAVPSSSESSAASRGMRSHLITPPGLGCTAAPSIPSAKDMRGRLVASVLLSRGSGRPLGVYLRRRLSGEQTGYVKSGLSQLVAAAA